MKSLINILIILAAHFSLTPFAPAKDGKWFLWPFGQDSHPVFSFIGGLPAQPNGMITAILSGIAGLGFVLSLLARFGWLVPVAWIAPTLISSLPAQSSYLLFISTSGQFCQWSLIWRSLVSFNKENLKL